MTMPAPPLPAVPLSYREPTRGGGRPGVLTAIGIISLIVGGLGALGGISGVFSGIAYLNMSSMTVPMPVFSASAGASTTAAAPTGGGIFVAGALMDPSQSNDGLDANGRQMAVFGMQSALAMNPKEI